MLFQTDVLSNINNLHVLKWLGLELGFGLGLIACNYAKVHVKVLLRFLVKCVPIIFLLFTLKNHFNSIRPMVLFLSAKI